MSYFFTTTTSKSYEEALEKVTSELKKEGFGILTTIDVKETLKKNWMSISAATKFLGPAIPLLLTRLCCLRIR